MHKSLLLLLLVSLLLPFCTTDPCSDLGGRYKDIRSEYEKIKTKIDEHREAGYERRLKKLLERVQALEIDFDGCVIGKKYNILDKLGQMIDSDKVSQLKNEIAQSIRRDANDPDSDIHEWEIRSAIRKIEDNLQELYANIKIDEAGNVELQDHRFYIESVKIEIVDSGISIACIRNELCVSDNLNTTEIPIDHMKAQRIVA